MTPQDAALGLIEAVGRAYSDDGDVSVALIPGQVMVDDWCWSGCETAYVRLNTAHHSAAFPQPDGRPGPPQGPLAVQFHVGINRCVSGMAENGTPPTAGELTEDGFTLLDDLCRLRTALVAWMADRGRGNVLLGPWTPVGPLGDCAGGFWTVTLRL